MVFDFSFPLSPYDCFFFSHILQQEETLVMFHAIELLRTIEALHSNGIVHGDITPSNVFVRSAAGDDDSWSMQWVQNGSGGWSERGEHSIENEDKKECVCVCVCGMKWVQVAGTSDSRGWK